MAETKGTFFFSVKHAYGDGVAEEVVPDLCVRSAGLAAIGHGAGRNPRSRTRRRKKKEHVPFTPRQTNTIHRICADL